MHYDAIVLGVGGMGSAALFDLTMRGKKVLGIEQYAIPHDRGSSHGSTRIIRLPYYENAAYVPLLREAFELWRKLEEHSGEKLLHSVGSIDVGPEHASGVFSNSQASCQLHDIDHEVLRADELSRRFPGYRVPSSFAAVYQRDGGFLASEACITEYVKCACSRGARVHAHERVKSWSTQDDSVIVETDRATYTSDSLVITAGPWAADHLKEWFDDKQFKAERQVLGWFQPSKPSWFAPKCFPVFNLQAEDLESRFYGFPVWGVPGFKIGKYNHRNQASTPGDSETYEIERDKDEAVLRVAADCYFEGAAETLLALRPCIFTNTDSGDPVIDALPGHPNVVFAAGFSGHGFKFCSVVGRILSALLLGDDACSAVTHSRFLRVPKAGT